MKLLTFLILFSIQFTSFFQSFQLCFFQSLQTSFFQSLQTSFFQSLQTSSFQNYISSHNYSISFFNNYSTNYYSPNSVQSQTLLCQNYPYLLRKSTNFENKKYPDLKTIKSLHMSYRFSKRIPFFVRVTVISSTSSKVIRISKKFIRVSPLLCIYYHCANLLLLAGDIELNPGPSQFEQFTEKLNSLIEMKDSTSQLFSRQDIEAKINSLLSQRPLELKEIEKSMRIQKNYKLVSYQGTHILYRKDIGSIPARRVIAIEEIFNTIHQIHNCESKHYGRTKMYKDIKQLYYGITEEVCGLAREVSTYKTCQLKKGRKSIKSIVVKPIQSHSYLSRGQVDLIDLSDMNLTENMSPDLVTPYKYLLVYIDHFTKKLMLTPLKHKSALEVCEALLDIFCEQGPPHILHSDNGGEFSNHLLFSTLESKWPNTKIIHGKPRHPECQGAVERVNREVKDALFAMMTDNNDQCWVKYLRWVKINYNTSYHTTIKMTPFQAVYGKVLSFGLNHFSIPREFWQNINNEEEMLNFISKVNESTTNQHDTEESPDFSDFQEYHKASLEKNLPQSLVDDYDSQVSCSSIDYSNLISAPLGLGLDTFTTRSDSVLGITSCTSSNCTVCGEETSQAHTCPGCFRYIHAICGREDTEEGFGSPVWCPPCDVREKNLRCDTLRLGMKRSQEQLHARMINSSNKKFKPAEVGDSILLPISRPDIVSSIGPRNLTGCITSKKDDMYTIGTSEGILSCNYTRNQFEVCSSQILPIDEIPIRNISQTEAMRKASLGIESGSSCRCKHCKTMRCPCKKANRSCNTKCHKGNSCLNYIRYTST